MAISTGKGVREESSHAFKAFTKARENHHSEDLELIWFGLLLCLCDEVGKKGPSYM